jgi:hypothetical protein
MGNRPRAAQKYGDERRQLKQSESLFDLKFRLKVVSLQHLKLPIKGNPNRFAGAGRNNPALIGKADLWSAPSDKTIKE